MFEFFSFKKKKKIIIGKISHFLPALRTSLYIRNSGGISQLHHDSCWSQILRFEGFLEDDFIDVFTLTMKF